MMKRLLSLLMALCLVLGMLPVSALAADNGEQAYELRTLTFEDADYKGDTNYAGGNNWSSMIDSSQYSGSLLYPTDGTIYNWYDKGNTYLKHQFADEWGDHKYWGGGEAISNYNSGDYATYGNYDNQLTVYKSGVSGMATTGGGHNGSNNFAMHYGYTDSTSYSPKKQQALSFGDGVARVIDHMYVNNGCYAINCYYNGNDQTASIGESDWVKIVATGYHADGTTATAEFYLVNGPDNIVTEWTKWDLSSLGEITKMEWAVNGSSDNGYGFSQPAYFAYDDVAVRFPKGDGGEVEFNIDLSSCTETVTGKHYGVKKEDPNNFEAKTITSGQKNIISFTVGAYDGYLVELETAKTSSIVGWNVNGTEYSLSETSTQYSLDNDVLISVGSGDNDTLKFDLVMGAQNLAYATAGTWEIKPVLHTCVFDKQVATEDYLVSAATCKEAAKYYLSCQCGKSGTETFTSGDKADHKDTDGDGLCDTCETKLNRVPVLVKGVEAKRTVTIQTGQSYLLSDLEQGKIFTDPDGDTLTYASYFYQRSTDGGQTWGQRTGFEASGFGGNNMSFAHSTPGTYIYKFWANDGKGDSEDTWTLTLKVMDEVTADINFYVGQDQNYSTNGNVMPVLELYKTAGIDEKQYDYVGWFTNAFGKTEYVYDPHEYTIIEGETDYVDIGGTKYELHGYEKITFTNSSFVDTDKEATPSGTVVENYNMFYASVKTGRYSTRFYGYNKDTKEYDIFLGGQSMELPVETDIYGGGGSDLYFRVVSCYTTVKNADKQYLTDKDYWVEINMPVTGSKIHSGDSYVSSSKTYYPFMLWANGNASLYNVYTYPYDTDNYIFNQTINQTTTAGYKVVTKSVKVNDAIVLTATVPDSGEFGLYFQYNNFNTEEVKPIGDAVENDDGTKTLRYKISKNNGNYTWRLTDPSGAHATKAGWLKNLTASTEKTFTFSSETNSKSHDFSQLGTTVVNRDEADIQLFADDSGFVSTTSTQRIRAYRMWQLINSDTANIMLEPDYNVQVLQGNAGDIKQVDGGNGGGNWLDVTPTTTDIVAVSYNAIDVYTNNDNYGTHGGFFPATNPERTAVMVVTNETAGTADASISFNGSKETSRGTQWDYNYDTWFYLDTDKAPTLDFTVAGTGDVSVSYAAVTTNASLKSTLSDWTTVTADDDGRYHADLLAFRNAGTLGGTVIIRMTDSTGTSYRLARVAQMSVTVTNADDADAKIVPGSKVKLTFDGLYRSVNKISGIFNPTAYYLYYTAGEAETKGLVSQYQQMDKASITVTIPEDLEPDEDGRLTYTLTNGYCYGSMYSASSPFSTMYKMTDTGVGTNFSAVGVAFVLSRMADVTIDMGKGYTVTMPKDANCTVNGKTVAVGDSNYTFTVEPDVGYQAGSNLTVKVNGEPVTADSKGVYTVENVSSALTITVTGMEKIEWKPVTVYFSRSHDEKYVKGKGSGEVMAMKEIKVPYFDLSLYGLEDFYFSSESYGKSDDYVDGGTPSSDLEPGTAQFAYGKITMLHLYIYATEVYYCGVEEADAGKGYLYTQNLMGDEDGTFTLTGSAGSAYLNASWGMDENLNYYLNYKYPLASEGWGSTADQILLHDGDIITMGHFSDWSAYTDELAFFNFLKVGDKFDKVTAKQGDKVSLTAYLAGASESGNYATAHTVRTTQPDIYYTAYPAASEDVTTWTKVGTAAADGTISLDTTNMTPGTYLVAMAGQYGKTYTDKIVSAPGGILLVVEKGDTTVKGDMDGNGRLTLMDAIAIYNLVLAGDATEAQVKLGDMNNDGLLTLMDAIAIYNAVLSDS